MRWFGFALGFHLHSRIKLSAKALQMQDKVLKEPCNVGALITRTKCRA